MRVRAGVFVLFIAGILLSIFLVLLSQPNSAGESKNLSKHEPASFRWPWANQALADNPATSSNVRVLTYHNDVARSGLNPDEKILTPANVNSDSFGKVAFLSVDGSVDAQPLYVSNVAVAGHSHNVVFAATEHDSVYAFDADNFAQLWQVTVLGANETSSDDRGCAQVSPEIGITATPVIAFNSEGRGVMYLVAMSKDKDGNYFQRLHALDITTGAEIADSPATIAATFHNLLGEITFDPKDYKERASLLFLDGNVYTSWASHCDNGSYTGWVIGYRSATLEQASVLNVTPNGSDGAIWMSGAGPAADAQGNIYLLDGNGTFDNALNAAGFPINGDFGNGFLKLSANAQNLKVADYFEMHNTSAESNVDRDLGSGGALVLPDLQDSFGKTWQLAIGAGKDGHIYVVNRNSMGKFNSEQDSAIHQELDHALAGGVYATPAYFGGTVYFGAVGDALKAFSIVNANLVPKATSKTSTKFAYPGTTPSISANGAANGIAWAVESRGSDAGVLHAYEASNLANELYNSNWAGVRDNFADNKFIAPIIANGKVFVGTPTGVAVFGLLH